MQSENTVTRPTLRRLVMAFLLFIVPVIVFAKIALEVREPQPVGLDLWILGLIHQWASPFVEVLMITITNLGDALLVILLTLGLTGLLVYKRRRRAATLLLFSIGGAAIVSFTLKVLFQRTRPELWPHLVDESGYSFPSGHAMMSSAFALAIIVLLWPTRWRWLAIILGGVYVGIIGLSRLYLGVHFPTDIVAGWCVSLAWVVIVAVTMRLVPIPKFLQKAVQ